MGTTRKFLRNMDKMTMSNLGKATKLQKVVSAVTAMGFVLQPVAALANGIVEAGNGATVEVNGNVTNVWAGTVVNENVAMNVFKKFDVDANNIANMYFREKGGELEANNLVNMVGDKININGTVNAIRNNKIGGHIFFLSSDGIAVGATGVINAGQLTMMTPSKRFMDTAMAAAGTDGVLTDATNAVVNIFDDNYKADVDTWKNAYLIKNWKKFEQMDIAINKSATITVKGNINTIGGMRMKAAHIDISKDVDNETNPNNVNPLLQSGVLDFSNFVNTTDFKDKNGNNINIGTKLTAAEANDGSGDIVLSAVANTVNHYDDYAGALSKNVEGNNTVQATVNVGENAKIIAHEFAQKDKDNSSKTTAVKGGIDISATATAGDENAYFLGIDIADTNAAEILGGKIAKTEAKINIDGKLEADTINIAAVAENTYDEEALSNVGTLKEKLTEFAESSVPIIGDAQDALGLDVDVSYAKLASNAEVTIGERATLTATGDAKLDAQPDNDNEDSGWRQGGALNISAISKLEAEVGAEVESEGNEEEGNKGKAAAGQTGANKKKNNNTLAKVMPNAGIAIVDTNNNAAVKVQGTLKAENGDANVSASAVNSVEAASGVTAVADKETGAESNYINAAVTVANVNNSSKVELDVKEANIGGELNALAKSASEVTTGASAGSDKNALLNSAINVTDASSTADLVIGGKITADTMNLAAENTISNEMQATNKLGETKCEVRSKMGKGTLSSIFGKANKKVKKGDKVDSIGKYFSAGAAVNVVDETNKATVTIKRGAQLTATNSGLDNEGKPNKDKDGNIIPTINISANNTIEDSFMSATSVINNYTGGKGNTSSSGNVSTGTTSNTAAMASAAVLSADMDNSAQVILEGSDDTTSAPVIKGANVSINANSAFEYDRLGSMIDGLKDDYNDTVEKYKDVLNSAGEWTNALEKISSYLDNPSVDGAMDISEAFQNVADTISLAYVDTATGVPDDLKTLMEDLLKFADVSNYTNFYTAASTAGGNAVGKAGGSGSGSGQAKVAATGSINLNSIKNNAQVIVGKGAKIDASVTDANNNVTKGNLNISATAKQHDVALNGKTKYFIPTISNTSGASTAIGGSVGVHDADVNSLVVIGEGASLTGNDVNLSAENDLQHTAITFGGGKATNDGITGMFAYMEGQSNSIISVDDDASINAANKLELKANNDTTISNIIFDRTSAGNTAVGASIGIVDYKVNNIAAVADNDSDATRCEDEEVKELVGLVHNQLSDEEKAQLGTKTENETQGSVTANEVVVNAATTGTITSVSVAGTTAGETQKRGSSSSSGSGFKLPAQISGAGSASVNLVQGNTAALLEGVTVNSTGDKRKVSVSASDDSMIGAYSGAAALKKQGFGSGNNSNFSAGLAGAVAFNGVKTGVTAQIKDASINSAKNISNIAKREGAVVAAGLAAEINTKANTGGTSVNAAASASANDIDNTVHAVLNNVSTSGGDKTDIANIAQDKDIQVAGGITAQYAKGGIGAGVAASYQNANNDIQSKIIGGNFNNVGNLQAYAASQMVQVGTAVSVGVLSGQSANGVEGAVAINNLTNNVGVTIDGATINAESVDAKAFDGKIESTIAGDENTANKANKHLGTLAQDGFDVTGQDAMDDVNAQDSDVTVDETKYGQENTNNGADGKSSDSFTASNKGNLIVTGATSVIVNTSGQGKATLGGAVSTNDIKNNFTTKISGGIITANGVNAEAKSDTLMVGVAAGVAASTGQTGAGLAGSASVMQLANNTTATIEKATINAAKTAVNAATSSRLINITGQVSATKGNVAAGLTTATNVLNNTTGAYIKGSNLNGKDGAATDVDVKAENKSDAYAIAVGVAASTNASGGAANGAVAVNKGVNNTEAIIDKAEDNTRTTINNAKTIGVNALDETKLKAISGGVTFSSGYAGVGGAVSYNQIGEAGEDKQQRITAQLNNTDITTANEDSNITVATQDNSDMLAIAAGLALTTGSTGAAAQGSAATTILHKNNEASMNGTNIDKSKTADAKAILEVTADSTAKTITSADAIGLTAGNLAGGAAVAVTNSNSNTKASITGGNMNLKSGKVQADSDVKIVNVGVGVAVGTGQGGALAGNVAVNNISNNTLASISGATMNTTGSLGVLANSKEHIKNYAGALSAAVGQGYAAGGLSTAVNVISGDTKATVTGSTITAGGNDAGISVKEYYKDENDKKYKDKDETLTGFVVNADSAHEIDNVVVTGGVAATAEFAVAGTGTVTVNTIKGETEASVTDTDVNATGTVGDKANVSVRANDNTEIDSHVGSASIAASANGGVGVGIASDSNVMSRNVTAKVAGDNDKKTVNANKLVVNAFNKHDITSSTTGVAVGAGAYAGVGVAGTISVVKTDAETNATVENIEGKNNGFTVNADHVNKLLAISNAAALGGAVGGASIGAGVSIVQDGSKTQATLKGSNFDHYQDNAQDSVTAHNDTDLTSSTASGAASISIGAGVSDVITINNIDNTVQTTVEKSNIGSTKQAGKVTVDATNDLKTKFVAVSAAGGLVGVGMGIGVNTIDTSVVTNVTGGSMKAGTVAITANENRDIYQNAVSAGVGGVAGSATVMVTNIGSKVSEEYGLTSAETVDQNGNTTNTETGAQKVDISGAFTKANESAAAQDKLFGDNGINSNGILGTAGTTGLNMGTGLDSADYKTGVQANKGGDTNNNNIDVQGVKVNVSNAYITASGSATIKANAETKADITVGNAAVGAVSVGSTVGVLDVKRNSGVNITGGNITANNLTVGSDQSGTAKIDVYQAAASGANFGLFYSGVKLHGNNDINIKGAQLSGKTGVAITTNDTTTASLQTIGGSFALTENANIFVVDGKNESRSTITVDKDKENKNSEIKAENGDVVITAKHGDGTTKTMTANIIPVSVAGVASGLGFNAMVEDNSITAVDIKDNQQFTAKNNVNINAENNSVNKVTSVAANAALGVAVGATGVQAKGKATSKLTVGSNNTFTGNTVNLGAKANVNNKASITSIGAGFGNFMVNWATANGGTDVDVHIGYNTYNTENVNIKGESVITQDAHAQGITVGMYTSGTNLAKADSNEDVDVIVGGNNSNADNNVNIEAKGTINQTVDSQGYGGAYFDVSPAAAITKSNIASKINAKVTGIWAAKTMDISAVHDNNVNLKTDALKAAAVGLSGVWSFSDVTNNTGVTLEGATITTEGDVAVKAQNDITYTNEVLGGGYGALVGNAMDAQDKFALNTNVALKNADVTSKNGKVEMYAITGDGVGTDGKPKANIDKNVTLKSAGLVAGSLAFSKDDVKINNTITVDKDSALATKGNSLKKDANDIKLIAADMLGFTDVATANTQGGAVGAASTDLDAEFDRKNTITINGTVDSNYDATFNAGGNSIMNVTLRSNAYNKTAAPIVANPGLDYKMKQTNTVVIGDNGDTNTVQTARNINLIGDTGNTTIATEAKSWKWTDGGESGTGSIASTADGTQSKDDELNNGVQVDGKLLAGKNSKLDIVIDSSVDKKKNLDKAIEEATVGVTLKDLEAKLDQAQKAYDADDNVKSLDEKRQILAGKEDLLTNNSNVYGQLSTEKSYWQRKVDEASTTKKNAETELQSFKNTTLNKYNTDKKQADSNYIDISWEALENLINTQNSPENTTYAKDLAAKNNAVKKAANDLEAKTAKLESKNKELGSYNTSTLTTEITELQKEIIALESTVKESEVGKNLANAQKAYDDALKNHEVTSATINTSIFKDKEGNYITVTAPDWFKQQYGNVYKENGVGMADYAAGLLTRLNELTTIMQSYKGTETANKYTSELGRIQSELVALGLGYYDAENKNFLIAENASTVPTIELKDLVVSGGNIDITGGYLKGKNTGKMIAVGDAQINIENKTDFFLKVNNVTIDDAGGSIKFNDTSITGKYGDIAVDTTPSKATGSNAKISIKNTTSTIASNSDLFTPDIGIFGDIYNPYGVVEITNSKNSIYVAGKIMSEDGSIKQNAGSIKGRSIKLTAGNAITQGYSDGIKDIAGTPSKSVDQKYVEAIQKALIDKVADKNASQKYYTSFKTVDELAKFIQTITVDGKCPTTDEAKEIAEALTGQNTSSENGIAAAGAIYINAASINVNGTIQSGASDYTIKFNDKDISKLEVVKKANGEVANDDSFYKNDNYRISSGNGFVYNKDTKQYEYQIEAWYNPATGTIFTEDIEQSGGGRIYLSGAIANTNTDTDGGKLVALDGGANINIDTSGKNYNLKLGKINADSVEGIITIKDTNTQKTTVYKRGSKTIGESAESDNLTSYNPESGLYYNWTNGESSQVISSYKRVTDSKWFGLSKKEWENEIGSVDQVTKESWKDGNDVVLNGQQKEQSSVINKGNVDGTYVGVTGSDDSKNSGIYQITFERSNKRKQGKDSADNLLYLDSEGNLTTSATGNTPYYLTEKNADGTTKKDSQGNPIYIYESEISDRVTTTKKKGLTGLWGKKVTTTWKETKGMMTAYNFGLKADNTIGIEFIGNTDGSKLNVIGNGNVLLNGDIRANDVKITSTNGSITTAGYNDTNVPSLNKTTIFTDKLTLDAKGDIQALQQSVGKALDLVATSSEGSIDMKMMAGVTDKNIAANSNLVSGNVFLGKVSAGKDITLDIQGKALSGSRSTYATRNANNANTETNISAVGKLILTTTGGIGEENNAHIIKAGEFASMLAESGDIWAKQEGNDAMKLKQVEAKNGNVHLEADGGFVDAIEDNQTNTASQADRIKEWKDQGILSDKSLADQKQANYDEQVDNLKAQANSDTILGNKFASEADRNAAADKLIKAGKKLTEELASDYNNYYAARKEMYAKQAALNDAISNKNNSTGTDDAYNAALADYNKSFAKYAQAKKTYEDNKASKIDAYVTGKYEDAQDGLKQKTNVSQWLANYEELTHQASGENRLDKYGWNQNQLLYALQDSIINPSAGSVSDVNKANIIGNNIYLKTNGDIGKVMDNQAFTISMEELSNMFTNGMPTNDTTDLKGRLDKLAGARADDVTWGTSQIEVKRLTPISVKLNKTNNPGDGKVSIDAPNAKNIYVIAKDSKLTMDKVISEGNVRLTGQEGIDIGTVTGSNISLEGGKGNIKHGNDSVLVGLVGDKGKLNANAAGNILLQQLTQANKPNNLKIPSNLNSDMVIGSLAAENITITATGNIVSGNDKIEVGNTTETKGISYINASEKLTLISGGSVGAEDNGLRIKNSGGVVDIDAANGAYLEAKGDGTLVLGKITTGTNASDNFVVNSEGSLSVGRDAVQEVKDENGNVVVAGVEAVTGSINAATTDAKANVKLTTAKDITFSGKVRVSELTAQSYAGDITQTTTTEDKNIEANKLNVSAIAGDIKLANENNVIKDINIEGLGGALDLVVSMDNLNMNLGSNENALSNNYGGDFKIKNNKGNINVVSANTNIYGNIELMAEKDFTIDAATENTKSILATNQKVGGNDAMLQPKGNITLTAGNNIENNGTITANAADVEGAEANITLKAKNVTNNNALDAKTAIDIDATGGSITNNGTAKAGQNVDLNASGNVNNNAKVEAGKDAILTAGGSVTTTNDGNIKSTNDTKLNAGNAIEVNGTINAKGNVEVTTTGGNVTINNTVESGKDTNINAGTNGSVNVNNTIKSGENTKLTANGNGVIKITKDITAGGSINGTTTNGSITVGENAPLTANNGSIKLTANNASDVAQGAITVNGKLTTNNNEGVIGNIELTTDHGNITLNAESEIKNTGSLITTVGVGNVTFADKANTNIKNGSLENNVTKGSIENNANVTIEKGNVKNTVGNGNVTINGVTNVTTGNVENKVTEGDVKFNGETTVGNGNITNEAGKGNVEFTNKTNVTTGDITNTVGTGNINFNASTSVGDGNISTTVDNGNIDYNAETNVNNGNIYTEAKNGNIDHDADMTVGTGNITDKASGTINAKDKGKADVKLEAINGSIDIDAGGDINLAEVIAANGTADINSANASIYLRKVNGKNVILIAKKNILADETYADKITTNGDNITLNISQDTGLVIDELLANTITIKKAKGSLDVEKMAVTNRADFDVNGMTTTVWGKEAPERVDSDSIYWFNVNDWLNNGDWMTLVFSEKQNVQRSNGLLLQLRNYRYVYNQRFTAVNHLHQLLAENKADEYDINFNPEVVHYFRHDLYDFDEREQQLEEHADPAKIVVEA